MKNKFFHILFLSIIFVQCQKNKDIEILNQNAKAINTNNKNMVDKNIILETLKNQKNLEKEETESKYTLSEKDLDILSNIISNDLKNKGYKLPTIEDFNNKIQTYFFINTKCQNYQTVNSRYIVYHGNLMDGTKKTLQDNLYESYADTENLFFDKQNLLIINFTLLKNIVIKNGENISINVPQNIIARNKFLFNDNKADYAWLKFNDKIFLEELVTKFGYIQNDDLNLFVMNEKISDSEEFGKILWNQKCSGDIKFHKNIFDLISKTDDNKRIKYLQVIADYLAKEIKDKNSTLSTNPQKKQEILGKIAYYSTKIGEKDNMYYDFFSILGTEDGGKKYDDEFKKNNYYGISDFKNIWEETKTGGISSPGME